MSVREVKKITKGQAAVDGAGVHLVRVVGFNDTKDYDPFLLLDGFDSKDPMDYIKGFPAHPHRGIETVTYLISGQIEHEDSLGNVGLISHGDCQWMTAGSGIIHQEMPLASDHMLGAQLWINMSADFKMSDPSYGDITSDQIPVIEEEGARIKVVAGEYKDTKGAFKGKYVDANYLDVEILVGQEWTMKTDPEHNLFVYVFYGKGVYGEKSEEVLDARQAILFTKDENFKAKAVGGSLRFILMSGKPLEEPISWGGPIVMNTREELQKAFEELRSDTFIKHSPA